MISETGVYNAFCVNYLDTDSVVNWQKELNRIVGLQELGLIQKHCCLFWTKTHLKWSEEKWKTVLWSDESKFEILFGNHGRCVLWIKEERDHPAGFQQAVQNPASLMVGGLH